MLPSVRGRPSPIPLEELLEVGGVSIEFAGRGEAS
jgi:hypothetical protein